MTIIFRGLKYVMINDMIRNQLTRLYKGKCSVIIRARTISSNYGWTECQGWGLVRGIRLILISCLLFCFVFSPFPLLYYLSLIRLFFFFKNARGEEVEKGGIAPFSTPDPTFLLNGAPDFASVCYNPLHSLERCANISIFNALWLSVSN